MRNKLFFALVSLIILLIPSMVLGFGENQDSVTQEIRKQILELPRYGVFDFITFQVNGSEVTLNGYVTDPMLKESAGRAVKNVKQVSSVDNKLQVLPASPNDDQIRRAVYDAIYGQSQLQRYSLGPVPSIHIIVNNGDVILAGVVNSQADATVAMAQARSVPGALSVQSQLIIGR